MHELAPALYRRVLPVHDRRSHSVVSDYAMLQSNERSELALLSAVLAGDPNAADRFLDAVSASVWSVVVRLEGDGPHAEAAFLHVVAGLKADGYARLKAFDRRGRLATYLAIVARDLLAERLVRALVVDPRNVWTKFERFFGADLRRRVAHRFPRDAGARDDAYQEICLRLIENDYRRVRAYDGHGSFVGYILTVVERILIDLVRREAPRRRLPAAVARLSRLDQDVYMAIVWENHPTDAGLLAMKMRGRFERDPDAAELRASVERLTGLVRLDPGLPSNPGDAVSLESAAEDGEVLAMADSTATPEEQLLLAEEERSRTALLASVRAAAAELPADERLYLQIAFSATDPLPAREIARLMQRPVEDIYRLKQRAQRWLADIASQFGKKSDPSV
jgi:RNA polymerase primary sigma factor